MDLSPLSGNAALKRQLSLQSDRRGLSHAYIISGPPGSGKHTLAGILSSALVCSDEGGASPCLHCSGCRKAAAGIHPDIIRTGGDGKDLTVAQIRALRSDAYIRPNEARRKVYILENAQSMNQSAQNAMLKLLEEGPAYAAFLLLTDNAAALLQTVRSRCETLSLSPVTHTEAEEFLLRRYPDKPREVVLSAARRCEGLLGQAVRELESVETDDTSRQAALTLIRCFAGENELSLLSHTVTLEKWDRDAFSRLLDESILLLRDALVIQSGSGLSSELEPARRQAAGEAAALPARCLLGAVTALERLRTACAFHAGSGHLAGWLCAALTQSRLA